MAFGSSDKNWEKFGRSDPYFGVITDGRFKHGRMTDESKTEFFETGECHIEHVLRIVDAHVMAGRKIERALDFGCGVGRLVIPLTKIAKEVTGVDISEGMLSEARRNCAGLEIGNVSFVRSDDELSLVTGRYDFVHSFIVLQHIPVSRGLRILKSMLRVLTDDGIGVLHFTYGKATFRRKSLAFLERYVPLSGGIINLARKRVFFAPRMQMNAYDMNAVFRILQMQGVREYHAEFTDHGGELGVILYFVKASSSTRGMSLQ